MAQLLAGTSGFAYTTWKPGFYPADCPARRFLEHYASRLNSTEVNYTFNRLPAAKSLAEWVEHTPAHFVFSLKAHQRLTHILRLQNCESFLETFLNVIDPLRVVGRLGPVLFQLPPNLKRDDARLASFISLLPAEQRFAFEFRNPDWLVPETYRSLESRGIALCLAESEKLVIPEVLTAPFVYFRLRKGDYSEADRSAIAGRVESLLSAGHDVFVYFKHEDSPAGALYAEELLGRFRTSAAA